MVQLGHIVLYVRELQASIDFYQQVVSLDVTGKVFNDRAAILTGGSTHHELLLIEVGDAPSPPQGRRLGLYHIGWCVGESLDQLREAKNASRRSVAPSMACPITPLASVSIFAIRITMKLNSSSIILVSTGGHPESGWSNR